jgi:starch phosphorylase
MAQSEPTIAYFSMEVGLEPGMATYGGGLGILAGDTIRAAADLRVPMVAVTLLHRKGYFYQRLDADGRQIEEPVDWPVDDFVEPLKERVEVQLDGRSVRVTAWKRDVVGHGGYKVPVYFLDTDLPENLDWDRKLTHYLYGGDEYYRLCQETVLGIGGVRLLRALGHTALHRFHMNEGHAALLALELLNERASAAGREVTHDDVDAVRRLCVFTTHTPVPAGHDKFPLDLARRVLGPRREFEMKDVFCCEGALNMTFLALNLSHYVNGVAKRHGDVSQQIFSRYRIDSITNGVHAATWMSPHFQRLFDRYIAGWREDHFSLRYAVSIPGDDVWAAHQAAKRELLELVNRSTNAGMDMDSLTLGFARRATAYKRPDLLFRDPDRLRHIARHAGKIQAVFAGKAHPKDEPGKELIRKVFAAKRELAHEVRVAYLENYDIELARMLTAGVDVWLNTPEPPLEASGTSGMKAALNGVPSLSVLDGWWIEGCIEGITGWAIGTDAHERPSGDGYRDAMFLYDKLERAVIPAFYGQREKFLDIMRHTIALNGSFFNTHRMMQQYVTKAYLLGE